MKAKLVREIPQREGLPYYFKTYEYECIECGEHYTRHQYNKRITPYCCKCNAKYEKQKQKERVVRHEQKIINMVLDQIRSEIASLPTNNVSRKFAFDVIDKYRIVEIIDKYR